MSKNWLAIIPGHVLSDDGLSSSAKVVYAAIASFTANGKKPAFPSHEAIALRAGLGKRTITRLVSELAQAGYITVHRRGRRLSNTYEIVTALNCDDAEVCNHPPAQGDCANERILSIKIIPNNSTETQSDSARKVYETYARRVRSGGQVEAIRAIEKLLASSYTADQLLMAINRYAESKECSREIQYRYKSTNFFGQRAHFVDFLEQSTPSDMPLRPAPRVLTAEEIMRRRRLQEAGQA